MKTIEAIEVGAALPEREYTATNVSLFLYNAAVWNAHRIHYDEPYATDVEKHPGVVIDGPLQGDWLTQTVLEWIGDDADLVRFQYSNRKASYLGDRLVAGGSVKAVDPTSREVTLEIFIKDQDGTVATPGSAVVRFKG
jgi:3-methylfumaryl-CoA hydratase